MQPTTLIVLACLVAVVAASTYESQPLDQVYESVYDAPENERSTRTKRGLLLLKKKLLLGALGLKAVKVGAVGVVGAAALKKSQNKHSSSTRYIDIHSRPSNVEVHSWSG